VTEPHERRSTEEQQQEQVEQALARARAALGSATRVGCLGLIVGGIWQSVTRRLRFSKRKAVLLLIGVVVVVLSVATCSAGVDLESLTAEYGEPAPATTNAARQFIERTTAAVQNASTNRRFRITISEGEATSVLSLGLMTPELMRAMETMSAEEIQQANDIEGLRAILRERDASARENRTLWQRFAGLFDPRLRTGDVQVQFTGNGEIVVAGYVQAWRWQVPALVVFAPRARSGELELDFVQGKLGRLPAPAGAFNMLGGLVASLLLQGRDYAELSNITVEEGRLTFEAAITR
jgi:hypothetical protein